MLFPRSCFSFLLFISTVLAALVNRTIDDTIQDSSGNSVQYSPNIPGRTAWNVGGDCDACTAGALNTSELFDKTWHDGTYNPVPGSNDFPNVPLNASFSFTGTAIYVFCVLARSTSGPDGNSDMSFYIDGVLSGTFVKQAPGEQGYDYHVPVYVNESLSPGQHDFLLQNGHVNGTKSLVLLDSIVYSFDDGLDSTSSSSSSGSSGVTKTPSSVLNPSSSSDSTNPSPSPSSGNANSASLGKYTDGTTPLTSFVLLLALSLVDTFIFGF